MSTHRSKPFQLSHDPDVCFLELTCSYDPPACPLRLAPSVRPRLPPSPFPESPSSLLDPPTSILELNVPPYASILSSSALRLPFPVPFVTPQVSFVSLPAGKEAVMTHIGEFPTAHLERRGSLNNTPGADLGDCSESRALVKKMLSVIDEEGAHKSKSFPAPNIVVFGHSHKPGIVVHQVSFLFPLSTLLLPPR